MAHSEQNTTDSRKRPWSAALEDSQGQEEKVGQPANPKSQRVSEGHGQAAGAGGRAADGAPLTANEACQQGLEKALEAVRAVLGHVADADQKAWCYNRIVSSLRIIGVDGEGVAGAAEKADPPPLPSAAVTAAAALRRCKVHGAIFTFSYALAKFRALLIMPVCIKYMDGRSIKVNVPRLGSVVDLRAAIAARTEVAATTVGLFVTGRDGEELRDNQRLVDVVGRNAGPRAGTAFARAREGRVLDVHRLLLHQRTILGCVRRLPAAAAGHRGRVGGAAGGCGSR